MGPGTRLQVVEDANAIEGWFPNLAGSGYEITSAASDEYNCIAWAVGVTTPWWGFQNPGDYWPPSLPRNYRIDTLMQLFAGQGYSLCEDEVLEPGFEKIAIFAFVGQFTHVARQLEDGQWTSKLGILETITHRSPADLSDGVYGNVHCIMRRPINDT